MKRKFMFGLTAVLLMAAVCFHAEVSASVLAAGERCLRVLIPSLYCFSILAGLCTGCGLPGRSGRGGLVCVLLFSQIGGYPVGAQLVCGMYRSGRLGRRDAQRMLCVCMGCGPGFLLGTVCSRLPLRVGLWMLLSVSLPNVAAGLWMLRRLEPLPERPGKRPDLPSLTDAVGQAAEAMLRICGMVLAMAAFLGMAEGAGLFRIGGMSGRTAAFLRSLLEVSCVTDWAAQGGSLPGAAALLAFGGLCVHLQIASVCGDLLPWGRFWAMRLLCSTAAWGICRAGLRLLLPEGAAEAAVTCGAPALTGGSIVPGACLLIMSALLLRQQSRLSKYLKI